jgi:hypothetical protein
MINVRALYCGESILMRVLNCKITEPYKDFLDSKIDKKNIITYTSNITDKKFDFLITLDEYKLDKYIKK